MLKPIVLFACPRMERVARNLLESKEFEPGSIVWDYFPDGMPNFRIQMDGENSLRGRDVAFLASFANLQDTVEQRWLANAFRYYQARSLTIVLPYFPTGTMERAEEPGVIATAKSLTRDLSSIPACAGMQNRLVIWDIHALPEWFIFEGCSVLPVLTSAVPLLQGILNGLSFHDQISIVFPDEGAYKRFGLQFAGWPRIICEKRREGEKRTVTIKEGDPRGRECVIVDDLAQTFGTQLECGRALYEACATTISMYATHLVAPLGSWRRICDASFPIANFWTTDSCPWTISEMENSGRSYAPFKVLSLADQLADQILAVREYFA